MALASMLTLAFVELAQTKIAKSPKEVLVDFVKIELGGARLTPESVQKTARFLVRPSTAPPQVIDVVIDKFEVHEISAAGSRAKLNLYFPYFYGWLDPVALSFREAPHLPSDDELVREGINIEYVLILTDKHWEVESSGMQPKEVLGPHEWRIENAPSFSTISLAAAIQYVAERRERTTDPTIKKNADATLAVLKRLK
jgi:hypothetical protein